MAYDLIKISALPETTPDESQDIVIGDGDYAKRIKYADVKADMVGTSPSYTTDTEPYLMRQTAHVGVVGKCALNKLVGGSLGWNQLIPTTGASKTDAGVTFTNNGNGTWTVTGTSTAATVFANLDYVANTTKYISGHVYFIGGIGSNVNIQIVASGTYASITATGQTIQKFSASSITASWARLHVATSGTTVNTTVTPQILDLTQEFGSTIADYVYGLEQATAGAGVAWLSKYIDLGTYHAYDAGSIQSVQATAHVTTEKNYLNQDTKTTTGASTWLNNSIYLPVGTYTFSMDSSATSGQCTLEVYNSSGTVIYNSSSEGNLSLANPVRTFTISEVGTLIKSYANVASTFSNIMVEKGSTRTAYEPYTAHTYLLGSDTLRGIPQLVSNKLSYGGDEKYPDGTIRRKYGIVDLGSLDWTYTSSSGRSFFTALTTTITPSPKLPFDNSYAFNAIIAGYDAAPMTATFRDRNFGADASGAGNRLLICDNRYTTAAAFTTAMNGQYMVYELQTPSTESSTAYQKVQTIDADGTESFTTSSPVPVGHETQTPDNILAALEWLGE